MKSRPKRDYEKWKRAKAMALELMKPGTRSFRHVITEMQLVGFDDLYCPSQPTLSRWAHDAGLVLKREEVWTESRKDEAVRMIDAGLSPKQVQSALRKKYGRPPAIKRIVEWHAAKGKSVDPWRVANLMVQTRNGTDREKTLKSVHHRLTKWGYGHLCERITMDQGFDLWEAGEFLERHGCHQVAIDTALMAVFTNSAGFLATGRECMKKKKLQREEVVMHSVNEFYSGVAA